MVSQYERFFGGFMGIVRILSIVAFAFVLIFLTGNFVVGIALTLIAFYVWMQQGEIDALHARIQKLEEENSKQQKGTAMRSN